jgi:hypothetical protein
MAAGLNRSNNVNRNSRWSSNTLFKPEQRTVISLMCNNLCFMKPQRFSIMIVASLQLPHADDPRVSLLPLIACFDCSVPSLHGRVARCFCKNAVHFLPFGRRSFFPFYR